MQLLENPTPIDQTINLQYDEPESLMGNDSSNQSRSNNSSTNLDEMARHQFDNNQDG